MTDFLIVGAGINGLLLARELAASNASVLLIDKGECGKEASWAGGGIVSPLYPWRYPPAVTALASWAQDFYPQLIAELTAETGIDAQLQRSGLLMLDAEDSIQALQWGRASNRAIESVAIDAIYQQEALLAPGFRSGLWMQDVANVRNPRLMKALYASLKLMPNVRIVEHCRLDGFHVAHDRIEAVSVHDSGSTNAISRMQASNYVICAGAWSGSLLASVGLELPVNPVKGQMLLFKTPRKYISSIVLTEGRYLIPRLDGHVLVGSTLEHSGFDKTPTDAGKEQLLQSACKLVPALGALKPLAHWAGLRPGAPDGIPFIGKLPIAENLYVNAGHYRNGLVLAPASARLLADCLLGRTPIVDPSPYLPALRGVGGDLISAP